jgi:FkbM family methyltransferase
MGMVKKLIKYILNKGGYNILKIDSSKVNVTGMEEGLLRMKELGILPDTIVDIGAAQGSWTTKGLKFWPNSRYELVEPLIENESHLKELKTTNKNINYHLAVAGESSGETWLEVSPDLDGSGVYGGSGLNSRRVPIVRVDDIVGETDGSILLKLDTHGYELPILKGAEEALRRTSLLVIEVYGFRVSPTCLLFHELSTELEKWGFRLIDMVDIMRRPGDNAFWQCDAFYIRKDHPVFKRATYD